jgi:small subunit ribosomal protein S16
MPVKIRLQRHGKKGHPYFHIVVADARSPRDGKYIERLGFYNPNTNPATIEIDVDGAVTWLNNGAQPTDTARAILSYKGVLYKNHLLKGVKKGALTEEQALEKFNAWVEEKVVKIDNKKKGLSEAASKAAVDRHRAEVQVNKTRAAAIAAANAPVVEEVEAPAEESAEATEAPVAEAPVAEAPVAEAPVAEAPVAEAPEASAAETPAAEEESKEDKA